MGRLRPCAWRLAGVKPPRNIESNRAVRRFIARASLPSWRARDLHSEEEAPGGTWPSRTNRVTGGVRSVPGAELPVAPRGEGEHGSGRRRTGPKPGHVVT